MNFCDTNCTTAYLYIIMSYLNQINIQNTIIGWFQIAKMSTNNNTHALTTT